MDYNITKSRVSVQSVSRIWNLNLFFYLVLLSPVPLVTNKYSNDQKIKRQMNFSKHANSEYGSSLTNATSFSFLLYFMFAIEMKK